MGQIALRVVTIAVAVLDGSEEKTEQAPIVYPEQISDYVDEKGIGR